jgi:glycosyltransferase involved in cell wall biosynthesis
MACTTGSRVGLLTARPASGAIASQPAGLLRMGLLARVYVVRTDASEGVRETLAQHVRQMAVTPLRYAGALCHSVATGRCSTFGAAVRIAAWARRDDVAHLHACDEESNVVAQWAAGFFGIGFSLTLPARLPAPSRPGRLVHQLRSARFVVSASSAGVQAAAALAPDIDVRRAYPGVDYRGFSPRLRRPSVRVPLVLAVATRGSAEGIGRVIGACQRMASLGHEVRCDIVCAEADTAIARARLDQADLHASVRILGPLNPELLADRLARAALYLQVPQSADGGSATDIPVAMLQAMAIGAPVMAEDSPVHAECIRHADSGWLVPVADAQALARALLHILTTPRLGEQLGKQARERVLERFDEELNLRDVKSWLEQAASCEPPTRRRTLRLHRQSQGLHRA